MSIQGVFSKKKLYELIDEIQEGNFDNFRNYSNEFNILDLNLRNKYVNKNLTYLALALQTTSVSSINLSYNQIRANEISDFINHLSDTSIKKIIMRGNLIDAQGASFVKLLEGTDVIELDISHNDLGTQGAAILATNLFDTKIRKINISRTGIGPQGAADFAKNIKRSHLASVDISFNNLGASGAAAFVNNLKETNVTHVDMHNNLIGVNGEFLPSFFKGTSITSVNLSGNGIDSLVAKAFAEWIPLTYLIFINFSQNNLNEDEIELLNLTLINNRKQLLYTPYYAICLRMLPAEKAEQYFNLPALGNDPTSDEELIYAGGILANPNLPTELFFHITSFLPLMRHSLTNSSSQAEKYLNLAISKSMEANNNILDEAKQLKKEQ